MKHWKLGVGLVAVLIALAATSATAQDNVTIYELQQDQIPLNTNVIIDSVVVIGVDVRPSTYGVYVQEPDGGPFSGILCYRAGNYPRYECDGDIPVVVGDLINATGFYTDFNGLAELQFVEFEYLGAVTPLAPVVLPVDSLSSSAPDGGERWEGVLVQVQDVEVIGLDQFSNWNIVNYGPGATGANILVYEKMIDNQVVPLIEDSLSTVTGVADWAFGARRIAPRGNDDIVILPGQGPPPAPDIAWASAENEFRVRFLVELDQAAAETTTNYSLSTFELITSASYDNATRTVTLTTSTDLVPSTTPHIVSMSNVNGASGVAMEGTQTATFIGGISTIEFCQTPISASNDTSQVFGNQVTIRGVVVGAGDCADFFPTIGGFYVQQRNATAFGGLFVFGPPVMPVRGDSVFVSGELDEFGSGPSTQISGVDEIVIYGNVTEVAPVPATVDDIVGEDNTAEQYEAMLVSISNVPVTTAITAPVFPGQPFDVHTAGDTLRIDDDAVDEGSLRMNFNGTDGYLASPYDRVSVTGIVTAEGSAPFQRLQPRNWNEPTDGGDIEVLETPSDATIPRYKTALQQNEPNPFNPTTQINFTIGSAGQASLRIFDLRGRLVATLFDEHRVAGPSQIVWDGRDDSGRRTPSGVYWYRLSTAAGEDYARKMVLLK